MASVEGMGVAELTAKINELKAEGKTESTSKSLGKYVDALKVLQPEKYGAETVASAQSKLLNSTTPTTQAQLGISSKGYSAGYSPSGFGAQPTIDLNKMYEESMNSPELQALEAELTAKKQAKDEASADINDNPFYSEATRVGKIAKLDEKALDEINTLQYQIDQMKADAQVKINIATQQYNIESDQYKNNLAQLNTLIDTGALSGATGADIAQIALATGMSTSMVNSIKDSLEQEDINPHVVNSTDDYGNVTVSIIDLNTGDLISSSSLGAIGSGSSKPAGGGSGFGVTAFINEQLYGQTNIDGSVTTYLYEVGQ